MAKVSAADKLIARGFDYAIDGNNGIFDPYYDDADVLKQLEINPALKAVELSKLTKLPSHRVIAAMMRLKAEGKLPVNPPPSIVVNFPGQDCSKGIIESEPLVVEEPLTVITLWQPWATLLIKGVKIHETRSWYTSHRGKILIHAAKRKINWNELDIESLEEIYPDVRAWEYPLGAIVGQMELVDCRQCGAVRVPISESDRLTGNWKDGRYAWEMRNIKPLLIPNVKGKQGLWKYEPLTVDDVVLGESVQSDEPEIKPDIPHWLTGKNAAEAKALIDLGFWCVGSVDNWGEVEASEIIETSGDWQFNYDQIGLFVEARCGGAVFNINVEDDQTPKQDRELVDQAIAAIKEAAKRWGEQFGEQLNLLELITPNCEQSQTNILLEEPPRQVEPNGQLSIFFDDSEEPPDPDDYPEDYQQQYEIWAKSHPDLVKAMAERIALIEKSKVVLGELTKNVELVSSTIKEQFQKGDRIQKLDNPKWIGEIKSISNKGAKIRTPLAYEYMADLAEYRLFSKADSEEILGESFFNIGDKVKTIDSNFSGKVFTVKAVYPTGMIGVGLGDLNYSFCSMYLSHHLEKIESKVKSIPLEQTEVTTKKRPQKGCGSGYLMVRQANIKRNAAKGRDPDIYYVYAFSYTNQYGKEIKSSISVPRAKIAQVKSMIEKREHYVKICRFLGRSVPMSY